MNSRPPAAEQPPSSGGSPSFPAISTYEIPRVLGYPRQWWLALAIGGLWAGFLTVLVLLNNDSVMLNQVQLGLADYVVTARRIAPGQWEAAASWNRPEVLGAISVDEPSGIRWSQASEWILPLKGRGTGYVIVAGDISIRDRSDPESPREIPISLDPLVYPATPQVLADLEHWKAEREKLRVEREKIRQEQRDRFRKFVETLPKGRPAPGDLPPAPATTTPPAESAPAVNGDLPAAPDPAAPVEPSDPAAPSKPAATPTEPAASSEPAERTEPASPVEPPAPAEPPAATNPETPAEGGSPTAPGSAPEPSVPE